MYYIVLNLNEYNIFFQKFLDCLELGFHIQVFFFILIKDRI